MSDFSRFAVIFGSQKKNVKTPESNQKRKRKSLDLIASKRKYNADESSFELSITRRSLNKTCNSTITPVFHEGSTDSPDKKHIHASCNLEHFSIEGSDFDDDRINQTILSRLQEATIKPEVYSPKIDNFSEGDDLFDISQEGDLINNINNEIMECYQQKPKYKPINKIPKPGGLMEKLREMKNKRLSKGCHYLKSKHEDPNQRKIEIKEHIIFRRRLLLCFRFIDDFETPDFDKAETYHYIVTTTDFGKFIEQHTVYDVVFDLPEQEFLNNHFLHFGKLIKAGKIV